MEFVLKNGFIFVVVAVALISLSLSHTHIHTQTRFGDWTSVQIISVVAVVVV